MQTDLASVAEMVKQWVKSVDPTNLVWAPGAAILAVWLLKTSLGRTALDRAPVRRSHQPLVAGGTGVVLLIWMMAPALAMYAVKPLVRDWVPWKVELLANVVMGAGALVTMAAGLTIARLSFARRWKGLGLHWVAMPSDMGAALVNLVAIWPFILAAMAVTIRVGETVYGPTYQMTQHKELELLTNTHHLSLQVSIIVLAVGVAPLVEELLFRGLLQTAIRSFTERAWPAVLLTSALFAMVHQNASHWPALFVLAVGMGYAYEKSGSLWRPIFIHALFNGATILSNL